MGDAYGRNLEFVTEADGNDRVEPEVVANIVADNLLLCGQVGLNDGVRRYIAAVRARRIAGLARENHRHLRRALVDESQLDGNADVAVPGSDIAPAEGEHRRCRTSCEGRGSCDRNRGAAYIGCVVESE